MTGPRTYYAAIWVEKSRACVTSPGVLGDYEKVFCDGIDVVAVSLNLLLRKLASEYAIEVDDFLDNFRVPHESDQDDDSTAVMYTAVESSVVAEYVFTVEKRFVSALSESDIVEHGLSVRH